MSLRFTVLAAVCALVLFGPLRADARSSSSSSKTAAAEAGKSKGASKQAKRGKRRAGRRVCTTKKGTKRCRWVDDFEGRSVAKSTLRTEQQDKPSGDIKLWLVNFGEELEVNIYDEDGALNEAVLARLDHAFRCRRTNDERAVDPRLYEVLATIYDHFGKRRIELVSGFRFQRNEGSRHYHASAMDIRIPGVSTRKLYKFAESLDTGGMGIGLYPTAGFVHVDFRAPGEPSYRWTDRSKAGGGDRKGKRPSRKWKRPPKPTS